MNKQIKTYQAVINCIKERCRELNRWIAENEHKKEITPMDLDEVDDQIGVLKSILREFDEI